jgi:hypothetical protein
VAEAVCAAALLSHLISSHLNLVFVLSSSLDAELLTLLIVVKGVKGPRPDSLPCSNYLMHVPFILDQRFHIECLN